MRKQNIVQAGSPDQTAARIFEACFVLSSGPCCFMAFTA
jgi:hypothetical protein